MEAESILLNSSQKPTVISYDLMGIMWESTTAQMMFVLKKKILTHYPTIQIMPQLKILNA